MDVLDAIHGRRAVRDDTDTAPSDAVIRDVIGEAVCLAAGIS